MWLSAGSIESTSPLPYTWLPSASSLSTLNFTFVAPTTPQLVTLALLISGDDYYHYRTVNVTIEVQPRIALSTLLDCGVDTLFYYEQPCLLTLTPAVAPEPELIVQLTLTNGQAQPSMLTFTNSAAPQQALITAVAEWTGAPSLTIGYTLLGSDFAHFFAVNDWYRCIDEAIGVSPMTVHRHRSAHSTSINRVN